MKFILPLIMGFLLGCNSLKSRIQKPISIEKFTESWIPGVVKTGDNTYMDAREVAVTYWDEYSHWNSRIYGQNSEEYKACKVDTNTWLFSKQCDDNMQYWYISHPAYWYYPIVGISYTQAEEYTKWRTKMVFLMMLYKHNVISVDTSSKFHSNFSIESFYSNPDYSEYHHLPYPKYSLPTPSDFEKNLHFADSFNAQNLKSCRQRSLLYKWGTKPIYCDEVISGKPKTLIINSLDTSENHFIKPIDCHTCRKDIIYHLQGNVAEFTSDSTVVMGGHWQQDIQTIQSKPLQQNTAPNHFTGFRNVCKWTYYKKE